MSNRDIDKFRQAVNIVTMPKQLNTQYKRYDRVQFNPQSRNINRREFKQHVVRQSHKKQKKIQQNIPQHNIKIKRISKKQFRSAQKYKEKFSDEIVKQACTKDSDCDSSNCIYDLTESKKGYCQPYNRINAPVGTKIEGNIYSTISSSNPNICKQRCIEDNRCKSWDFYYKDNIKHPENGMCNLQSNIDNLVPAKEKFTNIIEHNTNNTGGVAESGIMCEGKPAEVKDLEQCFKKGENKFICAGSDEVCPITLRPKTYGSGNKCCEQPCSGGGKFDNNNETCSYKDGKCSLNKNNESGLISCDTLNSFDCKNLGATRYYDKNNQCNICKGKFNKCSIGKNCGQIEKCTEDTKLNTPPCGGRYVTKLIPPRSANDGIDLYGFDIGVKSNNKSIADCALHCNNNEECNAFTLYGDICYLKEFTAPELEEIIKTPNGGKYGKNKKNSYSAVIDKKNKDKCQICFNGDGTVYNNNNECGNNGLFNKEQCQNERKNCMWRSTPYLTKEQKLNFTSRSNCHSGNSLCIFPKNNYTLHSCAHCASVPGWWGGPARGYCRCI